jgi:uridine kinase
MSIVSKYVEQVPIDVKHIAVDGCGGSGKSTFASELAVARANAVIVHMDDFYRPRAQQGVPPSSPGANYDLERVLAQVLEPLSRGQRGRYQRYDWGLDALAEWYEVAVDAVLILEGTYSMTLPLRSYFDYSVWVETSYKVRLARGVERDGKNMRSKWVDEWMPAEEEYIRQQAPKAAADLVIYGGGINGWKGAPVRARGMIVRS